MQEKTKNILIAILIVGLVSMTVAYAAFSQTLTISSSAKVNNTKWDIRIKNFAAAGTQNNLNGGSSEAVITPGYTTEGVTISGVEVTFKKPGDVAKFTFNLANDGDINAKLDSVTIGAPTTSGTNVTNEVKCGNTEKVVPTSQNKSNFNLAAGTSIACEMTLTYAANVTSMPATEQTVAIGNTVFNYSQN